MAPPGGNFWVSIGPSSAPRPSWPAFSPSPSTGSPPQNSCIGRARTIAAASVLHSLRTMKRGSSKNFRSVSLSALDRTAMRWQTCSKDPWLATPKARSIPRRVGLCTAPAKRSRMRSPSKLASSTRTPSRDTTPRSASPTTPSPSNTYVAYESLSADVHESQIQSWLGSAPSNDCTTMASTGQRKMTSAQAGYRRYERITARYRRLRIRLRCICMNTYTQK